MVLPRLRRQSRNVPLALQRLRRNAPRNAPFAPMPPIVPIPPLVVINQPPLDDNQDDQDEDSDFESQNSEEEDELPVPNQEGPINDQNQEVPIIDQIPLAFGQNGFRFPARSREDLLAAASEAHKKRSLDTKLAEALKILQLLDGSESSLVIDLNTPEIEVFQFSEAEKNQLLELFITLPAAKVSKEDTMQFLEGIERLGKNINTDDAERFQN
jgi:hypothetical protein